jgi:hypothetical protein
MAFVVDLGYVGITEIAPALARERFADPPFAFGFCLRAVPWTRSWAPSSCTPIPARRGAAPLALPAGIIEGRRS